MQIGIVGLGRMGANIARRLIKNGHEVVAFDRTASVVAQLAKDHATPATSLEDLVKLLKPPRAVWVMLPSGAVTEHCIDDLVAVLAKGDTIIDGGNTFYKDDI